MKRKTIEERVTEAEKALRPLLEDASAEEVSAVVFALGALGCGFRNAEIPDGPGWWARRRDGRTQWILISKNEAAPAPGSLWFGPFALPWDKR